MVSRHQPASNPHSTSNHIAYLDGEACFVNLVEGVKRIKGPFVSAND
jgi:hypothetical protein